MYRPTAFLSLALVLATVQLDSSWAQAKPTLAQRSSACGPVFALASQSYAETFTDRIAYSSRKESVIKEYVWVQRRALTYRAISEAASGKHFDAPIDRERAKSHHDSCFRDFSELGQALELDPGTVKINANLIDQSIEDSIVSKVPLGYQRLLRGSRLLREQIPFAVNQYATAKRLAFDPPNLVLFAEVEDGWVSKEDTNSVSQLFCLALADRQVDRALYPLIRLRLVDGEHTLATASGSQCN